MRKDIQAMKDKKCCNFIVQGSNCPNTQASILLRDELNISDKDAEKFLETFKLSFPKTFEWISSIQYGEG